MATNEKISFTKISAKIQQEIITHNYRKKKKLLPILNLASLIFLGGGGRKKENGKKKVMTLQHYPISFAIIYFS